MRPVVPVDGDSPPAAVRRAVPLSRSLLATALALVLLTLVLGWYHAVPGVIGTYHDDGIYVSTGWSIAHGRGYVHSSLPAALPQTKYPPLLPLLFAGIWRLEPDFPRNAPLFQAACLAAYALSIGLSFLYLVRFGYSRPGPAFAGVLLAATSSVHLYLAALPLAEALLCLTVVIALWTLDGAKRAPIGQWVKPFAAGLCLAAAVLTKSAAAALIPGAALLLAGSGMRKALGYLAGALPPVAAWYLWSLTAKAKSAAGILTYYIDYRQDWVDVSPRDLPLIAAQNLKALGDGVGLDLAPGAAFALLQVTPWAELVYLALGLFILWVFFAGSRRARPLALCWFPYFAVCVLHPWPPWRFIVPAIPLVAGVVLSSVADALGKQSATTSRFARFGCAALVGLNLAVVVLNAQRQHDRRYPALPFGNPLPAWSEYDKGFAWIRGNTRADDTVAAALDPMLWLYTGRKSFRPYVMRPKAMFYSSDRTEWWSEEDLIRGLREGNARYLLDAPLPGYRTERQFRKHVKALADRVPSPLTPVFRVPGGQTVIYRVESPAAAPRPGT